MFRFESNITHRSLPQTKPTHFNLYSKEAGLGTQISGLGTRFSVLVTHISVKFRKFLLNFAESIITKLLPRSL